MKDQLELLISQMHGSGIMFSEAKREFVKRYIMHVLQQNKGNQCKAARELGMHRNTLSRTMAELKLDIKNFREDRVCFRRHPQSAGGASAVQAQLPA